MRRLVVGTALLFAALTGGVLAAGAARATEPAADDWPVSRTYASAMYVDDAAGSAGEPVLAAYAGCGSWTLADYCPI
jgi:hypothetical protein